MLLRHRGRALPALPLFNAGFARAANAYARGVRSDRARAGWRWRCSPAALVVTYGFYSRIPTGFLPVEDQGYFFAVIQLPDGASVQRTEAVAEQVRDDPHAQPGVQDVVSVSGIQLPDRRQPVEHRRRIRRAEAVARARPGPDALQWSTPCARSCCDLRRRSA